MIQTHEEVITQTKSWIEKVVIGFNFCPFAAKPFKEDKVFYKVEPQSGLNSSLQTLVRECIRLEEDISIETTFIIFPDNYFEFEEYLDLVDISEQLLKKEGYEGIFQVASFHPRYLFSGSDENDPANYTNKSPFPMLHLLREVSLEAAIKKHPDVNAIPEKNIAKANELGLEYLKGLKFGNEII